MRCCGTHKFQCSSASRKFLNYEKYASLAEARAGISVLFSEPKIPQCTTAQSSGSAALISVLFSEPKIPQSSFTNIRLTGACISVLFSEPKIPQFPRAHLLQRLQVHFSALQRAENSSIQTETPSVGMRMRFQCSSASRKFLNREFRRTARLECRISVLFSEPKIPQCYRNKRRVSVVTDFSALQRAENSSMRTRRRDRRRPRVFQCSSASRKFLNISLIVDPLSVTKFQCSSASRKFLNVKSQNQR